MSWLKSKKWIIAFLIFGSLLFLIDSCMQFRMSSSEIETYFDKKGLKADEHHYRIGNRLINYVHVGNEKLPLVVFIHGSPGSLSGFIDFLGDTTLLEKAQLVSVDRPGFGSSNFGEAEPSLEKQAALIRPIIEKYKGVPVTLVGHSLGGPVIARMAMDYPELIDGLILVAPSIDPDLEPHEWFRGPLALPFLKWLLPRSIRASNDEIWKLKPELEKMIPLWPKVTANTIVIQGGKDDLVPPGNADFAQKMITNAPVDLVFNPDMNHFVPWGHPELIKDAILKMVATENHLTNLSAH